METLEAEGTSLSAWEEFQTNTCWRVLVREIELRDAYITQCLRLKDPSWTDDEMRARLNELEYVITIPQAIMTDLKISQQNKTNNDKGED